MIMNSDDNYKQEVSALQNVMPGIVDSYHALTGACFEAGELTPKQKHLVALGISLSHRDDNCVRYHVQEALHKGAAEKEIWETVGVAIAMSGGMIVSQSVHWINDVLSAPRH
ncbi:carboxymuconolactone decarboxylase family protein [Brevibacillus sp. B_LB10_24]|uniref:carboxymuconolactone decarboxylase family protein n=1 Tax=Brevibacillus sp. B_LB10_24 TaxID=3380645 RepID=UPI0038B708ED